MKAIGRISDKRNDSGYLEVWVYENDHFTVYALGNGFDIPHGFPDWGVFEVVEGDQFCKWVNPNTL